MNKQNNDWENKGSNEYLAKVLEKAYKPKQISETQIKSSKFVVDNFGDVLQRLGNEEPNIDTTQIVDKQVSMYKQSNNLLGEEK